MSENNTDRASRRVLGVFAHPDDSEFFAGGTFARWAGEGAEIIFLVATSGDKGSDDPEMTSKRLARIREEEQRNAASALGVKEVIFLRYTDGELYPTLELRKDIARVIRLKKPDVIVTLDPTVFWRDTDSLNHPDHRAIGAATLEAVFPTARDRLNYPVQELEEGLLTHKALTICIAGPAEPTMSIDITDTIDQKIRAILEHKTQIKEPDKLEQLVKERSLDGESDPANPRYLEYFRLIRLRR